MSKWIRKLNTSPLLEKNYINAVSKESSSVKLHLVSLILLLFFLFLFFEILPKEKITLQGFHILVEIVGTAFHI